MKFITYIVSLVVALYLFVGTSFAITFARDFVAPLVEWDAVYSELSWVDINKPFTESLKDIFYPPIWDSDGWAIWNIIRNIGVGILVIMLIWAWWMIIRSAWNPEERTNSFKNIMYILYGAVILLWSTWILWTVLNISDFSWLIEGEDSILNKAEEWLILQILGFMKAFAFFIAIALVTWYGWRLIFATGDEERIRSARTWLLNVMIALIFIKIIDFVYYIAQSWDVGSLAVDTIVNVAKFLWFIFGIAIFLSFLYVWFVFLTSSWNADRISRAWTLIKNIVVVMLTVMLFLLVVYQIFSEVTL